MLKITEWIKGVFTSKAELRRQIEGLQDVHQALEFKHKMILNKVNKMDEFVQSARDLQVKKNLKIDEKKKWLRGYPDQTNKDKEA